MNPHKILPFYMTYPLPMFYEEEDTVMRDLEYLQQMYPSEAKRYQRRIAEILDKMDYNGSVIYDEYPDKWMLYKLGNDIVNIIKQEELKKTESDKQIEMYEKWEWMGDLIQILLFYEIYKRRHDRRQGFLRF